MKSTLVSTVLPEIFTGIIQLKPSNNIELQVLQKIILKEFPNQKKIGKVGDDGKFISKLHCTLLHQAIPKLVKTKLGIRGDKALKSWFKSNCPNLKTPNLKLGSLGVVTSQDRISTFVKIENSHEIRAFLEKIFVSASINPKEIKLISDKDTRESNRVFHISLTNLTGNTGDSVANVSEGVLLENLK